jgi:hypothetical protein
MASPLVDAATYPALCRWPVFHQVFTEAAIRIRRSGFLQPTSQRTLRQVAAYVG